MSSLTTPEKSYLEAVLDMGDGYVLHFNDSKFSEFFRRYKVNIGDPKYQTYGHAKGIKGKENARILGGGAR